MGAKRETPELGSTGTLLTRAASILMAELRMQQNQLRSETPLHFDLTGNSLESVETLLALEKEFQVEILDVEAAKIQKIGELIDLVRRKLRGGISRKRRQGHTLNDARHREIVCNLYKWTS